MCLFDVHLRITLRLSHLYVVLTCVKLVRMVEFIHSSNKENDQSMIVGGLL